MKVKYILVVLVMLILQLGIGIKVGKSIQNKEVTVNNNCDTVYVPQSIDSAEVAVGYLRTNGVIPDEED